MKLDLVHDIQNSYRKVLNCMARPGKIENISIESEKADIEISFYKQTLVLMLMLLDAQVSFKIVSEKEHEITEFVKQLTYTKEQKPEEADYIFIFQDADEKIAAAAINKAKSGTLIDPHKSATIIIEAEQLTNDKGYVLKGPGIEAEAYLSINTKCSWYKERKNKISEYPLGIDFVFVDKASNIACLPRTTQVKKYGEEI